MGLDLRVEGEEDRGRIGRVVGLRHDPANRRHVPHAHVGDRRERLGEHGNPLAHERALLDFAVRHERAEDQRPVLLADRSQSVPHASEADQRARGDQPVAQQDRERGRPGDDLGVAAVLLEQPHDLLDGRGLMERERLGYPRGPPSTSTAPTTADRSYTVASYARGGARQRRQL